MNEEIINELKEYLLSDKTNNSEIEDFLGYQISADVLENLETNITETLSQMPEETIKAYYEKFCSDTEQNHMISRNRDLTGIICTIGLPYTGADKLDQAITRYIWNEVKQSKSPSRSITELLDYNQPKPTGIMTTMIYPNTPEKIRAISRTCNALIDRFGGQHVVFIIAKANLKDSLQAAVNCTTSDEKLLERAKNQITLIEEWQKIMNCKQNTNTNDRMQLDACIKPVDDINIRKAACIITSYKTNADNNINHNIQSFLYDMLLRPLDSRCSEWNEVYLDLIKNGDYTQYTNYKMRSEDKNIILGPYGSQNPTGKLISLRAAIDKHFHQIGCINYGSLWLDEMTEYMTNMIQHDSNVRVKYMDRNPKFNSLFLSSEGFYDKNGNLFDRNVPVLLPKAGISKKYEYDERLEAFTDIFGSEPRHKKDFAELMQICIYPGKNRGAYALIHYNDKTEHEQKILINVISAICHYKRIMMEQATVSHNFVEFVLESIGSPADATVIILDGLETEHINPWHDRNTNCNHIFIRFTKQNNHESSVSDYNVINYELNPIPKLANINPYELLTVTFLKNFMSWCYHMFKNK